MDIGGEFRLPPPPAGLRLGVCVTCDDGRVIVTEPGHHAQVYERGSYKARVWCDGFSEAGELAEGGYLRFEVQDKSVEIITTAAPA